MNKNLYRSKMALYGDTNATVAAALGITPQRNSAKLNGTHGADYSQQEIAMLKKRWNLSAEEVDSIFFASDVS